MRVIEQGRALLDRVVEAGHASDPSLAQHVLRVVLGGALFVAGVAHLTWGRTEFQGQVPDWFPGDPDVVVLVSGVVEIALGSAFVLLVRHRVVVGLLAAAFFVAIFPGNIAQYVEGKDAFGLDTDRERFTRLFFQPVLVAVALWSTGAWAGLRSLRPDDR